MSNTYNICLVPTGDLYDRLVLYSQELSSKNYSRFVLGPSSVPHATILQFATNQTEEQVFSAFLQLSCAKKINVNLAGLVLLPTDDGDLWCELAILKSSSILALQYSIMDELRSLAYEIKNAVADDFRPHFTVALNSMPSSTNKWTLPSLPASLLRASNEICDLRIGRSGENFQVTHLL